jgi:hypothetical protein
LRCLLPMELGRRVMGRGTRRERGRPRFHFAHERFVSIFVAWVVALSLSIHLGVPPRNPTAASSDKAQVLQELGALVGQSVALCEHDEGASPRGSPADGSDRCADTCPLCQLAGHAATFLTPAFSGPVIFPRFSKPLDLFQAADLGKPRPSASAQPRAPPNYA